MDQQNNEKVTLSERRRKLREEIKQRITQQDNEDIFKDLEGMVGQIGLSLISRLTLTRRVRIMKRTRSLGKHQRKVS